MPDAQSRMDLATCAVESLVGTTDPVSLKDSGFVFFTLI
jgi:hypothetical protein